MCNQRIERLLRDVYQRVLRLYYELFYHMEYIQLLDPENDLHLFSYIFIPQINRHLDEWKQAWLMHPMRSEHNESPYQLWTSGMLQFARSTILVGSEMFEELTQVYSYFHCNSHLCMLLILSSQDDLDCYGID